MSQTYNNNIKGKIYSYFINRRGMHEYKRGWLKGDCPFCGKADKFGVHISDRRANCFTCGDKISPLNVILRLEHLKEYRDVWVFLKAFEGVDYIEPSIIREVRKEHIELPEEYINIKLGDTRFGRMARDYIGITRKFDIDEVSYKGWGYCREGKYAGYIIIPIYLKGELIYFHTRKFFGNGPKYNNPTIEDTGIGKSGIIYNLDALSIYENVYLLEGILNAETIGDDAIATGGKSVSPKQKSMIIKSPVKSIVLLLDPDAIEESIDLGLDMVFYKNIKLVYWEGKKDVNDIGKEETLRRVNKFDWLRYTDLLKMKHGKKPITTYH